MGRRDAALDEGDLVVVSVFGHRLAEADDLDDLDEIQQSVLEVDDLQLIALTAREIEEGDTRFRLSRHTSASSLSRTVG